MKRITTLVLFLALFSCNSGNQTDKQSNSVPDSNTDIINELINDFSGIEKIQDKNPIAIFRQDADKKADRIVDLYKENINELMYFAKKYKHCFVVVGDHTIVQITGTEDCLESRSWGTCMPMVKGYIKKGDLQRKEDYLNNIIGIPDSQERKAYLFN